MKKTILFVLVLSLVLISAGSPPRVSMGADVSLVEFYDLQAEINNAVSGGTVVIPCGVYDIGDVIIESTAVWQKVVTVSGCAHANLGMADVQGGYQWTDPFFTNWGVFGTVLRGTISLRRGMYAGGTTPKLYLRDLSLVGYGSGVGLDYGDGTYMFPEGSVENVSIANYDIGIRLRRAYYMSLHDISMAGVGIGLQVIDANVITVSGLNISTCGTGMSLTGNGNNYVGGSVQGCQVGIVFGGSGSTLTAFYLEQNTTALQITGRANVVLGNYYAGNAGAVSITGHNNYLFMSEWVNPIAVLGNYNRVELSAYGSCTDTGFRNRCVKLFP